MASYHTIDSAEDARALARLLNGDQRRRPVVVVTIPAGHEEPWIDVQSVGRQVGDLAEVYLMPTNSVSWELSHHLPPLTQVYGGAGRVYPVGHEWVANPSRSPLRFAYDEREGALATDQLVDDALRMATLAGLVDDRPPRQRVQRTGSVLRIMAERALVRLDGDLGAVPDALAFAGVPLERCLARGMEVTGLYDPDSHWFDVRQSRLDPTTSLAPYRVGDLVLAQVESVGADEASVFLHPLVTVTIRREQVTSNDLDDLRGLMSPGEVLAARVTSTGPGWQLSLLDVDDDETPVPAASLFAGGPSWLEPPVESAEYGVDDHVAPAQPLTQAGPSTEVPQAAPVEVVDPDIAGSTVRRPEVPASPLMFDQRRHRQGSSERPAPGPDEPTTSRTVRDMGLTIDGLKAQVRSLSAELVQMTERVTANEVDLDHTTADLRRSQESVRRLEQQLQQSRARLRKARNARPTSEAPPVRFADRERGFRILVELAWARRIPAAEQTACPLPTYALGPDFLDSVEELEGIGPEKIADVVMEVLTGKAARSHGRELHRLRSADSGNAPYVIRESDGAQAMRVNLQTNTASARRLHYWLLPDGTIELAKVGLHDDYSM